MKMVGHKAESVYRRYAIVDEAMLRDAAVKLAARRGQSPGQSGLAIIEPTSWKDVKKLVGRDGIEPPTPGFSVLAVNPRIVRHFIELCFTARGASSRHVAVGCSLEQSVSDNLGDSHRAPAIARSKMTTPGSGCRHRHARDGLRFQPTARTRATRPSLVS
jgi:hypothetical protein